MAIQDHIKAILSGNIAKSNVIGIRKILNSEWRQSKGYSVSVTSPKFSREEFAQLGEALERVQPVISGPFHDSGIALLSSKRNRRQTEEFAADIESGILKFRLFDWVEFGGSHYPVFMVETRKGNFRFYNVPWQSGGNGPVCYR